MVEAELHLGEAMAANPQRSRASAVMTTLTIIAALTAAGCSQQKAVESTGDPELARPTAEECQIARAAVTAVHAAGEDARWRSAPGAIDMSLRTHSQVVNPADLPGYGDDEEADLLGKAPGDWRWCAGMGPFIAGLGWKPMGSDEVQAELGLGRPAMNKAGDEAKVYETLSASVNGAMKLAAGPWVATLKRGPNGWQVTSTEAAKHSKA